MFPKQTRRADIDPSLRWGDEFHSSERNVVVEIGVERRRLGT